VLQARASASAEPVTQLPQVISCVGIDTGGGTWGISFLDYIGTQLAGHMHLQVDNASALVIVETVLKNFYHDPQVIVGKFAGVEEFVDGPAAGRRSEGKVTRQGVFKAVQLLQSWGYHVKTRPATQVKTWARDNKLEAAGILQPPEMRHANDASRQALYTSCHDAYRPNPLR